MSLPESPVRPRWERRKESRPAELLAAALEVFVEKGFAGTRLEDVAARAGVSKGTLYLYFENKEELLKAVVSENIVARITDFAAKVRDYDGPTEPLLRQLAFTWWEQYGNTTAGGISKLMMAESGNFPEVARFFLKEVIEPSHALVESVIERGIKRREFRRVDVRTFVEVFIAPLVMLCLWQHSFGPCSERERDPRRYLETLVEVFLAALRPAPPAAAKRAARKTKTGRA